MASFRTTVRSPRSPEEVFAYLSEFSNAAEWDPGVEGAVMVTDAPVGLASRFRLISRFAGRKIPLDYVITAFDPPRRVVLEADHASFRSVDEITLAVTGGTTEVTYDAQLHVRGVLGRLVDPVMTLVFARIGARAAAGLRARLGA